ncbi:MAG: NAD-dependent epimerase/dehydratase family protein [Chloroflexi bacterium]|nr:NAD-dependent epimerase/dehydratase family protein [Chloroflexota bacterium]
MDLRGKKILITGAAGFIGGRLAERLRAEEGARVRGLVRSVGTFNKTSLQIGDIVDPDTTRRAVENCDVVIHCAAMQSGRAPLDEYRRVNVGGTLNLLRAARDVNAARFIHLSTINVHGMPPPRDAHADSPLVGAQFNCARTSDFYSISKAEGERAAWQFARENKIALTVIRPGCTYGPGSNAWTLTPLARIRRNRPVLIGGGNGICNAIYIDNLVDLILLALKNDVAIGHAFIGAEGRGVTWREFYGAYARMLGGKRLFGMPRLVALALTLPFELLARVDGYPPRLARSSVEFYSHRVVFDAEKTKRLLGYAPRVSFDEGMKRTEEWLRAGKFLQNDK